MEIRSESGLKESFEFSDREMSRMNHFSDSGFSIRVCYKGGWGFSSFNSPEKLEEFAAETVSQARHLAKDKTQLAPVDPVVDTVKLDLIEDPRRVSLEQKLDLFRGYITHCMDKFPGLARIKTYYFEEIRKIDFMNSEGADITQEKLDLGGSVTVFANRDALTQSRTVSSGSSNSFHVIRGWETELDKACEIALQLLDAPAVKGGKMPVILDPILASTFVHEAFGHMSEADDYHRNPGMKEIFTLGKRFGSDILTIYDTGLDIGSRGYIKYDDEGVPAEKTMLIENGILTGRLHSRESAALFNEKPTGNARTLNYRFPPICRMRNTCLAGGPHSFDDLISDIKLGVYAVDTNGGTGGEMFSFDAGYGYMIRNGRIAELIRDVQLSGNLFTTLKQIERIGKDFKIIDDAGGCGKGEQFPLETGTSAPHIFISRVTVGGDQ